MCYVAIDVPSFSKVFTRLRQSCRMYSYLSQPFHHLPIICRRGCLNMRLPRGMSMSQYRQILLGIQRQSSTAQPTVQSILGAAVDICVALPTAFPWVTSFYLTPPLTVSIRWGPGTHGTSRDLPISLTHPSNNPPLTWTRPDDGEKTLTTLTERNDRL